MKIVYCKTCCKYVLDRRKELATTVECPSCSTLISDGVNSYDCDSLGRTIYAAAAVGGSMNSVEPKRLVALMADISPTLNRETRMFSKVFDASCAGLAMQMLQDDSIEAESAAKRIKAILVNEEGLSEIWADSISSSLHIAALYLRNAPLPEIEELEQELSTSISQSGHKIEQMKAKSDESSGEANRKLYQGYENSGESSKGANISALLDRGFMALEDEEWGRAINFFDQVLNSDSRNADAYLGLTMEEGRCRTKNELVQAYTLPGSQLRRSKYFAKFKQFGNSDVQKWIQTLEEEAERRKIEKEKADNQARIAKQEAEDRARKERVEREAAIKKQLPAIRMKMEATAHMLSAHNHTVALTEDGKTLATGYNNRGQCKTEYWEEIISVSAGYEHTIGAKRNGSVSSMGSQFHSLPDVYNWRDIVSVSAGAKHSVGLRSNGTVVAIGENEEGQCNVRSWSGIVAISAGNLHTVGLTSRGTVVAVGFNKDGQCNVGGWRNIVAISAGSNITVGLKADGTAVAVGDNYCEASNVSGWRNIVAISAGVQHVVGIKYDGTVVATGRNDRGQCNISNWRDIVAIAAGFCYTVGLTRSGKLVGTGDNSYGQLNVAGWRLFNDYDSLVQTYEVNYREKLKRKANNLQQQRDALVKESEDLKVKQSSLRGLFANHRHLTIEARLAEIRRQLEQIEPQLQTELAYVKKQELLLGFVDEEELQKINGDNSSNNQADNREGAVAIQKTIKAVIHDDPSILTAVRRCDCKRVQQLLEEGANPNYSEKNTDGEIIFPLLLAVRNKDTATARVLIQYGADVNAKVDKKGVRYPLLFECIRTNKLEIVDLFLKNGSDVSNTYCLYEAIVSARNSDIVRELLEYGASPYYSNDQGRSLADANRYAPKAVPILKQFMIP